MCSNQYLLRKFRISDEESRVVLSEIDGDPLSSYINASYIQVNTSITCHLLCYYLCLYVDFGCFGILFFAYYYNFFIYFYLTAWGIVFTHGVRMVGKVCPACIPETIRCRRLIHGRDID